MLYFDIQFGIHIHIHEQYGTLYLSYNIDVRAFAINMSVVFSTVLTTFEKKNFEEKLQKKSRRYSDCIIWEGCQNQDGYGIIRPMFRGRRVTITVHRLAYYLYSSSGLLSRKSAR